jgi:hypothetical protein
MHLILAVTQMPEAVTVALVKVLGLEPSAAVAVGQPRLMLQVSRRYTALAVQAVAVTVVATARLVTTELLELQIQVVVAVLLPLLPQTHTAAEVQVSV